MDEQEQIPRFEYPVNRRDDSYKTIKWKIDPEEVINDLAHYLRGDVFDEINLAWKSQGFIYNFRIIAPIWVHEEIISLEENKVIKYDIASYNKQTKEGYYSFRDYEQEVSVENQEENIFINSFSIFINNLRKCQEIINNTRYAEVAEKENIEYSFEKNEPQRLLNEIGIRMINTRLRGYLNKNIRLSNISEEMIRKIALENSISMVKLLFTSYDKFNIKKENLSTILDVIDVNVYAILTSAQDGMFIHHLSTTERHIEHENVTFQNKPLEKKKWLPSIFGNWGGNE